MEVTVSRVTTEINPITQNEMFTKLKQSIGNFSIRFICGVYQSILTASNSSGSLRLALPLRGVRT